jgi:hypothetical protein
MNNKEKGAIAESQAIAYFVKNGYEVCIPIGDRRPYDLVIEKEGKLSKVQVKYAGLYKGGKHHVALRTMGGNQSYQSIKKYTNSDFDLLFIYCQNDKKLLVNWSKITNTNSIVVESSEFTRNLV